MKSPVKFNWVPLISATVAGVGLALFIAIYHYPEYGLNLFRIFVLLALVGFFVFIGYSLSYSTKFIFRRKVAHPVDPKTLVAGQVYWLNGQTWAKYVGQDEYTGEYGFNIYGIGNFDNPKDAMFYVPGVVKTYFSVTQEEQSVK